MNIGLVYLGILLLLGGCFLYMNYNLKNINLRITTLMELITALTSEIELIHQNIGLTNKNINGTTINVGGNIKETDNRELISDDDEEVDETDDEEPDETDDEDEVDVIEEIDEGKMGELKSNKTIEILDLTGNTDYDKMTVPELKKMVKDKNPDISITKLKKDELVSILLNN